MNEDLMNNVVEETANQDVAPVEETDGLTAEETNSVPGMIAGVVTTCIIIPAISAFATGYAAITGVKKAMNHYSDENIADRKARREARKAKRQARKEAKAMKKQKPCDVVTDDDSVDTDI